MGSPLREHVIYRSLTFMEKEQTRHRNRCLTHSPPMSNLKFPSPSQIEQKVLDASAKEVKDS